MQCLESTICIADRVQHCRRSVAAAIVDQDHLERRIHSFQHGQQPRMKRVDDQFLVEDGNYHRDDRLVFGYGQVGWE